jgi:succinate-acetate transporter protein
MAQYATPNEHEHIATTGIAIADPVPLGMSALAFTTAIVGCSYAGFIIPSLRSGLSLAVAAALFYGGIVQILAGMCGV